MSQAAVVARSNNDSVASCSAWPVVSLGTVIEYRKEFITIDDTVTYKRCRVQLHAKGIVLRDEIEGARIKTKTQQVCRTNDFLVAEIDAKVGGFGMVPNDLNGAIVSSHYFLFTVNESKLLTEFLGFYVRTPHFRDQVKAQGSTNYAAIRPAHVLQYAIPLPPVDEQRRIVAKVERLSGKVHEAREIRTQACERVRTLLASVLSDAFPQPADSTVATYAKVQSGYAFKSAWFTEDGVRLARNANVSHGALDWGDTARIPESMRGEYERFELSEGDILISLDRPLISTGLKVARVTQADLPCLLLQRVGRFQFHSDEVLPEYLYRWLHSPHFVHSIDPGRSNGVPHISQKDIERIPFVAPSISEQRSTIAKLDAVYEQVRSVERLQQKTATELDALLPSLLDKAFKGEL